MATRADVERFATAMEDIRRLAIADLQRWWARVDPSDVDVVKDAVLEFIPMLVDRYGQVAATVAADWFEELRDKAGVSGRFSAVLAELPSREAIQANARWAIAPLFDRPTGDIPSGAGGQQAVRRLVQVLSRQAVQSGKDTIALSAANDPARARWARVPRGSKTCAFCRAMASRGAVYRSKTTAGFENRYHADCDCTPTPMWDGDEYPDGYDPDGLYQQYRDARDAAGSGDLRKILETMREQQGIS